MIAPSDPTTDFPLAYSHQPIWAKRAAAADMDGDGIDELVIGSDVREIMILDWSDAHSSGVRP